EGRERKGEEGGERRGRERGFQRGQFQWNKTAQFLQGLYALIARCQIKDESIGHALPMGEHINISSAWTVIYLRGTVRPVSTSAPKRVMDV
ncbi:hypothetical protein FQN60_016850, partial [Etheostoma spectabile]